MEQEKLQLNKTINDQLAVLNKRQQEVLRARFGLKKSEPQTLEAIGKSYGITRERVRQIEEAACLILRSKINPAVDEIAKVSLDYLESLGGVRAENLFFDELYHAFGHSLARSLFDNHLRFIFSLSKSPKYSKEAKNFYAFWYCDNRNLERVKKLLSHFESVLSKHSSPVDQSKFSELFYRALKQISGINEAVALSYLTISKKFKFNPYGDFGLRHWPEIEPKGVRDKAYLVLKKHNQPLHFKKLTELIKSANFDRRPVHIETVHNELIKDPRFVLVGRGIYALTDWGYKMGTVKEIIRSYLKEKKSSTKDEILKYINSQRLVKESTILLNLQNRSLFKRLDNGKYTLV